MQKREVLITRIHRRDKFKLMNVVTITEDDNLLSPYGRAKWKRCIRSSCDCAFFAGLCTGGSPWNRLNKNVSEATAHQIGMKSIPLLGVMGRVFGLFDESYGIGCNGITRTS